MTKAQAKRLKYLPKLLQAIRERCLDCSAFNPYEVKLCGMKDCSLYPYRMGVLNSSTKITKGKTQTKQKTALMEEEREWNKN